MMGQLTSSEIENLLQSQSICRLACCEKGLPYIVPVSYYYDGSHIYIQTLRGRKLDILRQNHHVCLQVDQILSMNQWKSAHVYGLFEELKGETETAARAAFINSVYTLMAPSVTHTFGHDTQAQLDDRQRLKPVLFRIRITQKTGRFENPEPAKASIP